MLKVRHTGRGFRTDVEISGHRCDIEPNVVYFIYEMVEKLLTYLSGCFHMLAGRRVDHCVDCLK